MSLSSTVPDLQRNLIIGTSCSGKTTLARTLAATLNVPHIELDALFWLPQWTPRPLEQFKKLTQEAVTADQWVLDGNYSKVRDIIWLRATAIIWLNYPFSVVMGRAFSRTIKRVISREQLYSGNQESFKKAFLSRESILWWVITTYHRRRREYPKLFKRSEYAHLKVLEFQRPHETQAFIDRLKAGG